MDYDVDLSDAGILGAGAFADVRRATCRRTGKPVVVKVFRETDAIFADSLQRELDSLDAIRALTEREQREAAAGAAALKASRRGRLLVPAWPSSDRSPRPRVGPRRKRR